MDEAPPPDYAYSEHKIWMNPSHVYAYYEYMIWMKPQPPRTTPIMNI